MRALLRLLRWLLAAPLRFLGHRYVRIGGVLAITAAFLAYRPMDPAFYGVCGGFLALSVLARPLGRWIAPKPGPKTVAMPALSPRPSIQAVAAPEPPPRPAARPFEPQAPRRPLPSLAAVAPTAAFRSPTEQDIRARLPAQLQALLAGSQPTSRHGTKDI